MTDKAYEIRDYAHEPGWVHYVSESTTSVADAWTTAVPLDPDERKKFQAATPPKRFKTKAEAKPYLDALKAARLKDWSENSYFKKLYGRSRPVWKIYLVEEAET